MKTTENYLSEIREIRKMMEESSRFLSLSGLSGLLTGIYALIGAFLAYRIINSETLPTTQVISPDIKSRLIGLAALVLVLSLATIIFLTYRKVLKAGKKFWNPGSRLMLLNLAIPLITGGIFILAFVSRNNYEIVAPGCLIFYGLSQINVAKFTRQEIFYMGLFEISLGILSSLFPAFGLLFWAIGFGVVHIIYGAVMYVRYELTK